MNSLTTDILIVGAGPAGLAAAEAASSVGELSTTVIDDNPTIGGQIWRAQLGKTAPGPRGSRPREEADRTILDPERVTTLTSTQVFACVDQNSLLAATPTGTLELSYNKLILATGARECFLPFPGWTVPGVYGAGGLQAMVKGGLAIDGKRVVIAGTGPLLLAVADYLKAKGARILLIAEQTPAAKIRRFARGLWRSPEKMVQAAALRARLLGIPYNTDSWVTAANGDTKLTSVEIVRRGKRSTIECDHLACGYHLVPNLELAALLGCHIQDGFVDVDDLQHTSADNIFCAGELAGIGGVEAAIVEGKIAGLAAAGSKTDARQLFSERTRTKRFAAALDRTFALRDELRHVADENTLVCRCEDVSYDQMSRFATFREAKLQTRCGMGPCQGRVCGTAAQFLFGWEAPSVRPPIFPVKMEDL